MSIRLGRVSEDTIRNALLYIRAEIVRDNLDGLEHVDALLQMRGHEPCHVPRRTDRRFKRGELARLILEALRDGPMTGRQIAERVASQRVGLTVADAYKRVYVGLAKMQAHGHVRHEGRMWLVL